MRLFLVGRRKGNDMTIRLEDIQDPIEGVDIWTQRQVAKKLGKSPDTFRKWRSTKKAERFNRVVQEVEPNKFYGPSVVRYMQGAGI